MENKAPVPQIAFCEREPVGEMELANHGEGFIRFGRHCRHGGEDIPLCEEVISAIVLRRQ